MTSHLDTPERHPIRALGTITGPVIVVAPHPDDESLACGGLLARLGDAGTEARIVVVTDGTGSHPNSAEYPHDRLRDLREAETRDAAAALGLDERAVRFLRLPDGRLGDADFDAATAVLAEALRGAATVFAPWDQDPHPDHVATAALTAAACARLGGVRQVAYPVWAYVRAEGPATGGTPWRLDITEALGRKRAAIAAHRSQTTGLISDDPDGFVLSHDVLAHFNRSDELFWDLS